MMLGFKRCGRVCDPPLGSDLHPSWISLTLERMPHVTGALNPLHRYLTLKGAPCASGWGLSDNILNVKPLRAQKLLSVMNHITLLLHKCYQ